MLSFKRLLQRLIGSRISGTTTGQGEEGPNISFEGRLVGVGIDFFVLDINGSTGIIRMAEVVELRRVPNRQLRKARPSRSFRSLRGKLNITFTHAIQPLIGRTVVAFTTASAVDVELEGSSSISGTLARVGCDFIVIVDGETGRRRVVRIPQMIALNFGFN
ncbi:hypothetical protein [Ammoniphilus sp. YIM 78166]|uniref:hypothetical protein n=1 Tax=Ammoniphilus sp. YIM 78166 TaxID=1644106 RepID=UPI00106FA0DD|nr:hypothetical protein [Ammoniphilus sp. YIM 78166]